MKRYSSMTAVLALMLAGALALTGCPKTTGDDDPDTSTIPTIPVSDPVDKTALQAALTAANATKAGTSPSIYWVITADLDTIETTFDSAITAAQTVYDNADADQAAIDSAKTTLEAATTAYTGQKHDTGTNPVAVLTAIKTAYNSGNSPGTLGTQASPTSVTIIVSGTITDTSGASAYGWLDITGENAYPPIVLQGAASGGTLNVAAAPSTNVLHIENNNKVTLGAHLTLTGGTGSLGYGVRVDSPATFIMNGGTISGNIGANYGAGIRVIGGLATFTMNGGTISGNTSTGAGGGVSVETNATFTMNDGTISGNSSNSRGGGVEVEGTFTMEGGTISGNTATAAGGGVNVHTAATAFTKNGGTIYGSDAGGDLANKVTTGLSGGTHYGYAVYWAKTSYLRKFDNTLGPTSAGNLSTAYNTTPWVLAQ
ncbi:hypothetical protein AGMMS49942_13970 [Spirochaetia bacterium]|nr:hypothetical protein AGMMS49942_13970 [Spirochaetia bacterium]